MARRPKRDGSASWIANIAARTGADDATVEDVLERRRIKASPSMTRPRRLTLKRIAFSGEKHGTLTEGAFDFAWSDLETGLYAILSDGNLKGKSSILHVDAGCCGDRRPTGSRRTSRRGSGKPASSSP
jgi:hypothetical protein